MNDPPRCSIKGCVRPRRRRDLCGAHDHKRRRHGDPNVSTKPLLKGGTPEERLRENSRLNPETGCIEWTARRNAAGYGEIRHDGRTKLAHRLAMELEGHDISGRLVRHFVCDNPPCINTEHLRAGSHSDNLNDRYRRDAESRGVSYAGRHAIYVEYEIRCLDKKYGALTALARKHGISTTTVQKYVRRGREGTLRAPGEQYGDIKQHEPKGTYTND